MVKRNSLAIVHSDEFCANSKGAIQLCFIVNFDQCGQPGLSREIVESSQLFVVENRDDQKNCVRLATLGHRTGVANMLGLRVSGFLAWLLWRTIYLAKLPTFEKKLRVALRWTLDLPFPKISHKP